jgi:hypothetical protein
MLECFIGATIYRTPHCPMPSADQKRLDLSIALIAVCLAVGAVATPAFARGDKLVAGWIERVRVYPGDLLIDAKLDTGADLSSLHCHCSEPFTRDGARWVHFDVTDKTGKTLTLERKIQRIVSIKRHFGKDQERVVVLLGVCLGDVYKEAEVSLVDRSNLTYKMLVGRNFMAGNVIVDPDATHTLQAKCKDAPRP